MKPPSLKGLEALGCIQGVQHPARLPNSSPILPSRKLPGVPKAPPSTVGWDSLLLPPNRECQTPSPTKPRGTSDTSVMLAPDGHVFPRQTQRFLNPAAEAVMDKPGPLETLG